MTPLPPLSDLELLARHAPTIYGRALDPDKPTLTPQPVNGRPDWVDGRSAEIGRAVGALRALLALSAEGPAGYQLASIMWVCRVQCGLAVRGGLGYVLVSALFGTLPPLPPEPQRPPQRSGRRPPDKATRETDRRLKAAHEAWTKGWDVRQEEGEKLYDRAEVAWLARVQRRAVG
jgi:hypothetical protein